LKTEDFEKHQFNFPAPSQAEKFYKGKMMKTIKNNPIIRQGEMIEQQFENELLVYDLRTNRAYCLNETSKLVYQLCDGNNSVEEITLQISKKLNQPVMEEFVWLALDQFQQDNLLSDKNQLEINFKGRSRREVIKKIGLASMIAFPLISSVVAPTAVNAQSCQAFGQSCTFDDGRRGNCCDPTNRCTNTGILACQACLITGFNTNCNSGAGCCTSQLSSFSNSCCNGVTETFAGTFPVTGNVYSCVCN
jgi:hypothetical protein